MSKLEKTETGYRITGGFSTKKKSDMEMLKVECKKVMINKMKVKDKIKTDVLVIKKKRKPKKVKTEIIEPVEEIKEVV